VRAPSICSVETLMMAVMFILIPKVAQVWMGRRDMVL
jgi:hypothetical protein